MGDFSYENKLEMLGAFEINFDMLKLAKNNEKNCTLLNAGRGNPNWINTQSRLAFARLLEWGVFESKKTMDLENMAGYTLQNGMYDRFIDYIKKEDETNIFLKKAFDYCVNTLKLDKDSLIKELTDAVIGNNYPVPSRCLVNIEKILNAYLQSALYNGVDLKNDTIIFPTEVGTAAMCYLFDSLKHNGLLNEGDKIAINTPIFTPYIQIPHLTGFSMVEVNLKSREDMNWTIDINELDKLKDPEIKAFFLVNPSNPGARALSDEALEKIADIVKERDDLIIVTDDVYGTFVDDFQTVYSVAPHNTILVYSYSKLYGVTGWRVGLIAMHKDNVCDRLIKKLPKEKLKDLDYDYSIISPDVDNLPFVERVCADSRNIGLYHTSGLSTPQQVLMALMSLTHLVHEEKDPYFESSKNIISTRYNNLFDTLDISGDNNRLNAKYYTLINVYDLAKKVYDKDFSTWMKDNFNPLDFLYRLAEEHKTVLMTGVGFGAEPGTVRISQANLPDDAYKEIAERILDILDKYHEFYTGCPIR